MSPKHLNVMLEELTESRTHNARAHFVMGQQADPQIRSECCSNRLSTKVLRAVQRNARQFKQQRIASKTEGSKKPRSKEAQTASGSTEEIMRTGAQRTKRRPAGCRRPCANPRRCMRNSTRSKMKAWIQWKDTAKHSGPVKAETASDALIRRGKAAGTVRK